MTCYYVNPSLDVRILDKQENIIHDFSPEVKDKVWGSETIIENSHLYTCKLMTLKPDTTCSMHFHKDKKETFVLITGTMNLEIINLTTGKNTTIYLQAQGESVTLEPYVPHRFYIPEGQETETTFIECSTKDSNSDNYRFTPSQAFNSRGSNN